MAISENPQWEQFLTEHRWAVLTTLRGNGSPNSSVVAYAHDGDSLVVSTPGGTFKRSSIEKNAAVNLCVISNAEPINFVAIEGSATIEHDNLLENTRKVFAAISDTNYQEPESLQEWLDTQARVIIRIRPDRVYGVIR